MYPAPIKQTVQQLHKAGKSNRDISKLLSMSRNTVRAILNESESDTSHHAGGNKDCDKAFKQQPEIKRSQVMSLAKLTFIKQFENITFIGKPGTGKTGLAISLLRLALTDGYRGRFYNAQDLLTDLYTSLADRTTSSLLKTIASYDLLVIDELGYLTLNQEQINIFFKLIDMRYHKKSTIITTNLDYPLPSNRTLLSNGTISPLPTFHHRVLNAQ